MSGFTVVNIGTNTSTVGGTIAVTVPAITVPKNAIVAVLVTEKSTSGSLGTLADTQSNTYNVISGASAALGGANANGQGILFLSRIVTPLVNGNTITYTKNLSGAAAAISAFYINNVGFNNALSATVDVSAVATGTTGTITVTSPTPHSAGDIAIGCLFDSGTTTAGGNATFTQASGFNTPPNEANTGGSGNARVNGGFEFSPTGGTVTYAPTLSSTAQQWALGIVLLYANPFIAGQYVTDLPPPPIDSSILYRTWIGPKAPSPPPAVLALPLLDSNKDWPNPPPVQWNFPWVWNSFPYWPPPVRPQSAVFRGPYYANIRGPDYQVDLRTWINPSITVVQNPFAQSDWPTPPPSQWYKTWEAWYNLNLIGQDAMPAAFRKEHYDLPPISAEPNPRRDWEWNQIPYIGKDRLPFRNDHVLPPAYYVIELNPRRDWEWRQVGYLGKDVLPFRNDHVLPPADYVVEPNPRRSWEWWYNLNLIGQDKLPIRQQDWPNPPPVYWYRDWLFHLPQEEPQTNPFNQFDWPNPYPVQWYRDWSAILGPGLLIAPFKQTDWPTPPPVQWYKDWEWRQVDKLGFDILPFREQDWPNPKDYSRLPDYSWIYPLYILPIPAGAKPFLQSDWPLPIPYEISPRRSWEWWYNLNLIGKDQLPNRQQDWPNPLPVQWYRDWEGTLGPGTLLPPFRQSDWPNPRDYQRLPDYGYVFILDESLQPVARLPFNQSDWPLPRAFQAIDQFFSQNLSEIPGPPIVVVTDLHFKPHLISMGRMGYLGGLS